MTNRVGFGSVSGILGVGANKSTYHSIVLRGRGVARIGAIRVGYNSTTYTAAYDPTGFRGGRLIVISGELPTPNGNIEPLAIPTAASNTFDPEKLLGVPLFDSSITGYPGETFQFPDNFPLYGQKDIPITVIQTYAYQNGDLTNAPSDFMGRLSVVGDFYFDKESDRVLKLREV